MSTVNWLAFILQMIIMLLFPVGLAIFFKRRFRVSWAVFFIAAGFYLVNLVVQLPFLFAWQTLFAKTPWLKLALVALTYGVCEETMRYLSFRAGSVMRANRNANGALMAGSGHGGAESIVFAIGAAFSLLTALLMPQALKASGVSAVDILQAPWWMFALRGLDRVLAIMTHLGFATLIIFAYRRSWLFYPLAVLAHFTVDFTTFGVQAWTGSMLWMYLVFVLWMLTALLLLLQARRLDDLATGQKEPDFESVSTNVPA